MGYGIKVRVWGDYACFSRPEMKVERVSYDVMTPSAAKGLLEAIYWKPAIHWKIDRIHVMNPIEFTNIRRNEVSEVLKLSHVKRAIDKSENLFISVADNRHQRAALVLKNVEYILEAHFEMNMERAGTADKVEKHYNILLRRLRKGKCFQQPFLGSREFPASFQIVEESEAVPKSRLKGERDLGYMLHYLLYSVDNEGEKQEIIPTFFRGKLIDGVMTVPDMSEVVF